MEFNSGFKGLRNLSHSFPYRHLWSAKENFNGPTETGNSITDTSQAVEINLKQTDGASNA